MLFNCCLFVGCGGWFVHLLVVALALIRCSSCLCLGYCVGGCFTYSGFR